MPELALDDIERHALAGHLNGVSVTKLMRGEAASHAGLNGEAAELCPGGWRCHGRPQVGPLMTQKQRPDCAVLDPRSKLLLAPLVHTDLASPIALAVANEDGAARGIEVALGQAKRLGDSKARPPQHDDQAAHACS